MPLARAGLVMSADRKLAASGLAAIAFFTMVAAACGSGGGSSGFGSSSGTGSSDSGGGGSSGGGSSSGGPTFGASSSGGDTSDASYEGGPSGPITCDPSCMAAGGACTAGVCTISENPGGVSGGNQTSLGGTGTADSAFAWLYPYDNTVFPRGLLPITLQFGGTPFDAAKIQVTFPGMSYTAITRRAPPQTRLRSPLPYGRRSRRPPKRRARCR